MKTGGKLAGLAVFVLLMIGTAVWMVHRSGHYKVDLDEKETPERFTEFLEDCTLEERIALMQSLRGLKQEIGADCYGKLDGLLEKDKYTKDKKNVTDKMVLFPGTYNEVSPMTVVDAMAKGHLSEELVSPLNIKKEMVWRRYNKANYVFHEKERLDYHRDYVLWAARKCGINEKDSDALSTFCLEQEIYKKKFADIWDKLKPEQRLRLLSRIEKNAGSVGDKVAIVAMSGAGAIATLSATAAFAGFAFYSTITSGMAIAAGWVGITLPFVAYTTTTTTICLLTGPIGWCIASAGLIGGGIAAGWPDADLIVSFVMTANIIKAKRL